MKSKYCRSSRSIRWNGQRRAAPVESLSARLIRLRIARRYSVYELAAEAGVMPNTIRQLEFGRPVDKRCLPPIAAALGVPYCRLLCGEHRCIERACVPAARLEAPS